MSFPLGLHGSGFELGPWQALPRSVPIRIVIDAGPTAETPDERAHTNAAWAAICDRNPRAFNGPILAFVSADPARAEVRVRRDEYRRLAVRPGIETGVVQLGVTGVLVARDHAGAAHALLGLRSHATRVFGGMWEFGPSGGIDPPTIDHRTMDADDIWRVLINEIREEVGLPVDPDPTPPVALLADPAGQSVEVIVPVRLARPVEELIAMIDRENSTSRWEYDAVRWIPTARLGEFVSSAAVIPSTIEIVERMFSRS